MPVTCPAACRCFTTVYLSSGNTSAKPSAPASRSTASLPAAAPAAFSSAMRRMLGKPTPRAISLAIASASPVSIFTDTPRSCSAAMSCLASARGGSYSVTNPSRVRAPGSGPRATAQRPIALERRFGHPRFQRLDRRRLEPASFGDRAHGALHHVQALPALFDHGFGAPVFFASNGANETGVTAGKPAKMFRCFAAARNARSIGS